MLAHWLPNDAKLGALQVAGRRRRQCGCACCRSVVQAACRRPRPACWPTTLTLAQVVPETRVCARVALQWDTGQRHGGAATPRCMPRPIVEQAWEATPQAIAGRAGGQRGRAHRAAAHTGLPLLLAARIRAALATRHAGAASASRKKPLPECTPPWRASVASWAALHATPLEALHSVDDLRKNAAALTDRRKQAAAALLLARWSPRGDRPSLDRLHRHGSAAGVPPRWPTSRLATLHGDLHARNILLDGWGAGLHRPRQRTPRPRRAGTRRLAGRRMPPRVARWPLASGRPGPASSLSCRPMSKRAWRRARRPAPAGVERGPPPALPPRLRRRWAT